MDILNTITTEAQPQTSSIGTTDLPTGRPMFPYTIDSTMLSAFRACPQKMFRTYVEHWKPKAESVHLVAGGAFAKGIEVARKTYYEGLSDGHSNINPGNAEDSVAAGVAALIQAYGDFECPPDSAKSLDRTLGALEYYFDQYPLGNDGLEPATFRNGTKAIEFSFAEPLDIVHPVSGDPILYTGRADLIGHFAGGLYVVDEKTTSSLGQSWSRQWEMRGQFSGYAWAAAKAAGMQVDGIMVRGISILKTKYDTMQVLTYRSQYEIDRWLDQTHRDIARMIKCWKDGYWDYALDGACTEYGGCSLTQVCKSADPKTWLPMYFERRVWDPLARRQMSVAEWEASWQPQ
jgi:hypothetical protein